MKILTPLIGFLLGALLFVPESAAQYPTQTPTRQEQARRNAEELNRRSREMRERFEKLRREQPNPEPRRSNKPRGKQSPGEPASSNPYIFKPSEADRRLVAPDAIDYTLIGETLRLPSTGLIRLLSDQGCREDRLIAFASNFCIRYRNLYGASVYSFRIQNYMPGRFGDVMYEDGTLRTLGEMTLGFLADLGKDVDFNSVSAETTGAKYVFDFVPPETTPLIESSLRAFETGVESGGFKYQKSFKLEENHTYLLRSVAYQSAVRNKKGKTKLSDDPLGDARRDVIVAFRVVGLSAAEEGGATLLWKELARRDAPQIVIDEK